MKFPLLLSLALAASAASVHTPDEHKRPPEQTFLTVPEWFLVFSPEEYAYVLQNKAPSDFPFFGHIGQFWQSYAAVTDATSDYPFNAGYHVMVSVIGISTTVEYAAKGLYERLVGHFTELLSGGAETDEDKIGARTAQTYVDFIKHTPWYEYDFLKPLTDLWTSAEPTGPNIWRKWERKYALTSEYGVKAGYAWLIGKATQASFERPSLETHVLLRKSQETTRAVLPRYQAFTDEAVRLAKSGANFVEIAGNREDILVSVITPRGAPPPAQSKVLYRQPILTQTDYERQALILTVDTLANTLRTLPASVTIEHIYDY